MLKVNGVSIPTPKSFKVNILDLDGESNRNAKGELIRDRIAVKRKLECEWAPLTMSQISTILNAVKDVYFQVEYPDPMAGATITKTFYVGDRTAPMYKNVNGEILWQGLQMDFIEK
ncbi:DUF6711 family protein [Geobacillus kaustophilus]|uniref:DUF6711 family protein n=1 Tax=Geobacillus kaustophilus TaxID=1462 RepID=UPI0005CD408A|nr:DUF6711 family protein [Geobacillus kaustophilus]